MKTNGYVWKGDWTTLPLAFVKGRSYVKGEPLPEATIESVDKRLNPNTGREELYGRVIRSGEPRFFLDQNERGNYNLIAVYQNGKGTARKSLNTFKHRNIEHTRELYPRLTPRQLEMFERQNRDLKFLLEDAKLPVVQSLSGEERKRRGLN